MFQLFKKKSALIKEIEIITKKEDKYRKKHLNKTDSKFNQILEDKVPEKLQSTLDIAFSKAFYMIFEKGTNIIEKTYDKDLVIQNYKINEYSNNLKQNKKTLRNFARNASKSSKWNFLFSGVSGVGLGILGIGLPDIALFTSLLLRNLYELSLNYGFDYQNEEEKYFILCLIQGALSYEDEFITIDEKIDCFITNGIYDEIDLNNNIQKASFCLSKELLYMKFLQGIPLVGAIGGAFDMIYMQKINEYAQLKYRKRFLLQQKEMF